MPRRWLGYTALGVVITLLDHQPVAYLGPYRRLLFSSWFRLCAFTPSWAAFTPSWAGVGQEIWAGRIGTGSTLA